MENCESGDGRREQVKVPLLKTYGTLKNDDIWTESKMLWRIVGPTIFTRVASYSLNIVTQSFAGRLGNLELASISLSITVILGFNFGLPLGMASALETLCGQAYGAKQYRMLGIYLQCSWVVLFLCAVLLLPVYIFTSPILKLLGQPDDLAEQSGLVTIWLIPVHFAFAFQLPLQRYLQCQFKTPITAYISWCVLAFHVFVNWLFLYKLSFGIIGAAVTMNISWWIIVLALFCYVVCGGCPDTWTGFSMEAFSGLWEFFKLSAASGVMLCLENWYYRILILMTGNLNNATIAVSALAVCMGINEWEMSIPLAFFSATGVRVANELGAGNGKAAKFASIISAITSLIIGLCICLLIMNFHGKLATIFTSSNIVIQEVDKLAMLLAITIFLNSIQPLISISTQSIRGSRWFRMASICGCYYVVGLPLGAVLGWFFHLGVQGIWSGMIGGTAIQTLILVIITISCDWDMQVEKASLRMTAKK
ncbi:hypothetical protein MKW94_020229 [Papaver nudicaule]|uniref:Protein DETOXIFICATION n=1 Tax=Papaver nudicaule TaxID=74823 RepID=A0AA41VCX2_PAPNU|nr:hypothetical protein [Papaver nudicaule]